MALLCPAPNPDIGLVHGLLGTVDCNISGLTREGYAALSGAGSPVMGVLTALLTIYVAFIGYRMLLGRAPLRVGDLTVSALKIGAVVMLATNWGAYQAVAYDTLFKGPEQLAALLLNTVQPEGSAFRGNPFDGLQLAFDEMQRSAGAFAARAGPQASVFLGGTGFGAFALNASSLLMLISSLGVILAAKIVLALLLGLAPLFAALLLFDATRGVLEGWLKAAIALAVAPMLATLLLALQLTLLEPTLVELARMRAEQRFDLSAPMTVFILMLVFQGVLLAAAVAGVMIASGVRIGRKAAPAPAEANTAVAAAETTSAAAMVPPSRAAAIAAAASAIERRESIRPVEAGMGAHDRRIAVGDRRAPAAQAVAAYRREPLGQSHRRSASPRRSAAGNRRDQ